MNRLLQFTHSALGRHHYNKTTYVVEEEDKAKKVWTLVRKCRCGAVTPYSSED